MKTGGIIAIIFGALNIFVGIAGLNSPFAERAIRNLGLGIGVIILGIYLISRANEKKEEQKEKDNWMKGE
jgi:uncharacterized membrane protein HdeD (DUF308 family)